MNQQKITKQDDPKTWVTPFAFDVAPNILYLPLASPVKRGLAMMVDGLLVAVLAESAGWIFVVLVLGTLIIQKQSKTVGRVFKWGLYLLMLLALVSALVGYYGDVTADLSEQGSDLTSNRHQLQPENSDADLATFTEMIGYIPAVFVASQCEDLACAQSKLAEVEQALSQSSLPAAKQTEIINDLVAGLPLSSIEKQPLYRQQGLEQVAPHVNDSDLNDSDLHDAAANKLDVNHSDANGLDVDDVGVNDLNINSNTAMSTNPAINKDTIIKAAKDLDLEIGAGFPESTVIEDEDSTTSPLAWIKGLLNDLGLGFGWAAFYFTVFTAWFDGQTLGKKLFGIRVIQLDGTKISLWDAFGRYGGYAAGFTTGLLGFFQIYWDANRQAIQDKISATVVIDVRKTKHEVALEHASIDNKFVNSDIENGANI
ncbi:RDD family protein [Shewanella sp. 30m-9]